MKALLSLGLLALGMSVPWTAHAQGVDELGPYGGLERRAARAQRFAFEVRVGPYSPRVDEALDGNPYEKTFGSSQRWHAGFEVDWQVLRIDRILSFGPGFAFGYTKSNADGFVVRTGERAAQATSLTILPMDLVGVLRVDALHHDLERAVGTVQREQAPGGVHSHVARLTARVEPGNREEVDVHRVSRAPHDGEPERLLLSRRERDDGDAVATALLEATDELLVEGVGERHERERPGPGCDGEAGQLVRR